MVAMAASHTPETEDLRKTYRNLIFELDREIKAHPDNDHNRRQLIRLRDDAEDALDDLGGRIPKPSDMPFSN